MDRQIETFIQTEISQSIMKAKELVPATYYNRLEVERCLITWYLRLVLLKSLSALKELLLNMDTEL